MSESTPNRFIVSERNVTREVIKETKPRTKEGIRRVIRRAILESDSKADARAKLKRMAVYMQYEGQSYALTTGQFLHWAFRDFSGVWLGIIYDSNKKPEFVKERQKKKGGKK